LSALNSAVEEYQFIHGAFPNAIADVITRDRFPDGAPKCPADGVYSLNDDKRAQCLKADGTKLHGTLEDWTASGA
jgi:hypothetical protein